MNDTLTYQEAANELAVTYQTVRNLVTHGRLHSIRTPGKTEKRIARAEIERYKGRQNGHSQEVPALATQTSEPIEKRIISAITEAWPTISAPFNQALATLVNGVVMASTGNPNMPTYEQVERALARLPEKAVDDFQERMVRASFTPEELQTPGTRERIEEAKREVRKQAPHETVELLRATAR